ncbi:hypothetical protein ACX3YC_10820 [Pseudomonas mohnii]
MGAPKMTDATIETAVQLLDGWRKKLHWDLYLAELESQINHRYTKAAMLRQPRIKSAWNEAKARAFASGESVHKGTALDQASRKILKLEHTVERLTRENNQLLEQFVRWAHNAGRRGLTPYDLDKPLPIPKRKSEK